MRIRPIGLPLATLLAAVLVGCVAGHRAAVDLMNLFEATVPAEHVLEPTRKSLGLGGISYKRLQGFDRTAFKLLDAGDARKVKWFSSVCQAAGAPPVLRMGIATGAAQAAAGIKVDGHSFEAPVALVRYASDTGETSSVGFVGTRNSVIPASGSSADEPPERRTACALSEAEFELAGLGAVPASGTVLLDGVLWRVADSGRELVTEAEGPTAAEIRAYAATLQSGFEAQGSVPWERAMFEEREKAGTLRVSSRVVFRSAGGRSATLRLEAAATVPARATLTIRFDKQLDQSANPRVAASG